MGPSIINKINRQQNPHYYKKNRSSFYFMKKYADSENKIYLYVYLVLNKILRKVNGLKFNDQNIQKVFAIHGSFFIIPYDCLKKITPIFDERIFLYTEENHVAEIAANNEIEIIVNKNLKILHKEDGSSSNVNTTLHTLESLKIYFENWEL